MLLMTVIICVTNLRALLEFVDILHAPTTYAKLSEEPLV